MTRPPRILAAALALAAAAACAPSGESVAMDGTTSPGGPEASAPGDTLPLRRLDESAAAHFRYNSGLEERGEQVIRDAAAWSALWARMVAPYRPTPPVPAVDFAREMVLVAAMGTRSSGGHVATIESVTRTGGGLAARVAHQRPGPSCGATGALTSPVDIAVVPRSDLPVRWEVREVVRDC